MEAWNVWSPLFLWCQQPLKLHVQIHGSLRGVLGLIFYMRDYLKCMRKSLMYWNCMSLLWYYVGNTEVWKYLYYFSNIKYSRLALLFLFHCTTLWRLLCYLKNFGRVQFKTAEKLVSESISHVYKWPWTVTTNLNKISFHRSNWTTNFEPSSGAKMTFLI